MSIFMPKLCSGDFNHAVGINGKQNMINHKRVAMCSYIQENVRRYERELSDK